MPCATVYSRLSMTASSRSNVCPTCPIYRLKAALLSKFSPRLNDHVKNFENSFCKNLPCRVEPHLSSHERFSCVFKCEGRKFDHNFYPKMWLPVQPTPPRLHGSIDGGCRVFPKLLTLIQNLPGTLRYSKCTSLHIFS